MSNATETGVAITDIAARDPQGAASGPSLEGERENAEILANLPDAVTAVLAKEGLADDEEAAAALTYLTTAALALGLPLTDETADMLERLADGDHSVGAERLLPVLWALIRSAGRGAVKRLGALWRQLWRGKKREDDKDEESKRSLPEPPLPRPTPGRPGERKDEESIDGGTDQKLSAPRVPLEDDEIPQIGDEAIDAQLRGVRDAIQHEVESAVQESKFGDRQTVRGDASNEDAIKRMRDDGRLKPDQEAHPPYLPDMSGYLSIIAEDGAEFVRITGNPNKPEGFWLMPKETFEKIIQHPDGAKVLMRLYAIPSKSPATHVVPVKLPKGTRVRIGAANGGPGLGPGGGVQIEILDPIKRTWFGKPQRFP